MPNLCQLLYIHNRNMDVSMFEKRSMIARKTRLSIAKAQKVLMPKFRSLQRSRSSANA